MATIYAQSWTSTSLFNYTADYQSTTYGGIHAPTDGYPELAAAEAARIVAGGGPTGGNAFAVSTGGGIDAQSAGGAFLNLGTSSGSWSGAEGRVTATVKFDTGYSVAAFDYYPILTAVSKRGSTSNQAGLFSADRSWWLGVDKASSFRLEMRYTQYGTGSTYASSYNVTIDNAWHDLDVRWKCAVANSSFNDSDTSGWIQVRVDNALVYDLTGLKLFLMNNVQNTLTGLWLGYYGMIGPYGDVAIYDVAADAPPPGQGRAGYPLWQSSPTSLAGTGAGV